MGCEARIVSAVGRDAAGDEMLAYLKARGLSTEFVQRHPTLPTSTVDIVLKGGHADYTIHEHVAWDDLRPDEAVIRAARESHAIIFGTLASRSETTRTTRTTLEALLEIEAPLRIIDVNLRRPFDDRARVLALARKADWIKLNEGEVEKLTARSVAAEHLLAAIAALSELTGVKRICVTQGEHGATAWDDSKVIHEPSPKVTVCDTIGAGDAFTAAFTYGLLTEPVAAQLPAILRRANRLGSIVAALPGGQPEYTEPA
jgi:fructokinase